ncbi:NADH-quinone oxidoreductase subunit N [Campylobacter sp. LR291e]|uniref:NADH-quinone oxidoreductase subunit N n=1 Tax=unclassified Campylobacter TaxID=2593542 RepID=UPI0012380FAC|nr:MULTISPECIES: NADH-quinone oxidoreductase subunit N [unclassified Campylobacter]KAA6227861.1 NADH-quinone oxidoreductase subunit N [Campylobacter sp. LR185c]KAA6229269.1 NADH-quinone oxidoreductase subunit N [Campylobacter sp. LR291e]KAA6231075.1 NADH-quinone oxidoreductase subunit N [Campylobacter sp. LR264d]KAA8604451.1 NADH-quinone oxidoreductase subunit N [Campylobacter sp. LR185c]
MNELLNLQELNLSLAYPFLFLIAVASILLLCACFYKFHRSFYISVSALSLLVSFLLMLSNVNDQGFEAKAFLGTLNNDLIAFCASSIILIFSFLYILMQKEENQGEFYALFLFMSASFLLMVSSSNLALIFIGLESSSLALYTLIAMRSTNNAISSAIKYFSVAAVGSGFFVMAVALFYARSASLDLAVLLQNSTKDVWLLGAGVLIFILCAIKLSLVPFHFWLRDVYYASHANLVAFISVVPKIAMLAVIVRLFDYLKNTGFELPILILACFSMLMGAIGAISQKDIKKMFAYSSIVHSSFIVTAIVPLLTPAKNILEFSLLPVFGYWTLFGFANYGAFLILSTLKDSNYSSLNGLLAKKPLTGFCLGTCALSLAGIPPFGVFWGKFMVLVATITSGYWFVAIIIALSSVIILYAYLKLIIHALFIKGETSPMQKLDLKQNLILSLCVCAGIFAVISML